MKFQAAARAALVAAALSGSAVPLLKERGEPVTHVVISNSSPLPLSAVVYRRDVDCADARPAAFDGRVATLDMPAKPWETVSFDYAETHKGVLSTCSGLGSFPADEEHEYHVDIGESSGICGMRVTRRAVGSSDPLMPVELMPRQTLAATRHGSAVGGNNRGGSGNQAPQCQADARFQPSLAGSAQGSGS